MVGVRDKEGDKYGWAKIGNGSHVRRSVVRSCLVEKARW